jgi:hypothetical protein
MTKLPSQSEVEIHWQAVPSLREIWTEERERMARLLPPKENFLSPDHDDFALTLSVKKGAPKPGSKLALDGNKMLFDSSPNLQNDFRRAMSDIVEKYKHSCDGFSSQLEDQKAKESSSPSKGITNEKQEHQQQRREQNLSTILSGKDETLEALEGLLDQFGSDNDCANNSSSQSMLSQRIGEMSHSLYSQTKSSRLSQSQLLVQSLTQVDFKEVQESIEFCMGVDRFDADIDESSDYVSLTPHNDGSDDNIFDEEDDMKEEEFEKSITTLGTQKVEKSQESLSQLQEIVHSWHSTQEVSLDEFALGQDSLQSGDQIKSLSPHIEEMECKTPPIRRKVLSLLSSDSPCLHITKGDLLELKRGPPPSKGDFEKSSHSGFWYPLKQNQDSCVKWLGFPSHSHVSDERSYKEVFWRGSYLEPVSGPPSSRKVRRWIQNSKAKRAIENQCNGLESDSNSRKLSNSESGKVKKRVEFVNDSLVTSSTLCDIEEAKWQAKNNNFTQESYGTSQSQDNECNVVIPKSGSLTNGAKTAIQSTATQMPSLTMQTNASDSVDPLQGIGNQGGKIYIEGGGLKASTKGNHRRQKKLSIMSIEVHVQCRVGKAGVNNSNDIAMRPDPTRDSIVAVCFVYGFDPGGGEQIKVLERGCIIMPTENELNSLKTAENSNTTSSASSRIGKTMGIASKCKVEVVSNEQQLLLRISSIVQWKDPDVLVSWDTQAGGLGYLIDRGFALGKKEEESSGQRKRMNIDMIRLLGRTPKCRAQKKDEDFMNPSEDSTEGRKQFNGSVLGADWDERVGAGAGPSSIVSAALL